MRSFGRNDFNIFNEIVCQIHETESLDAMRKGFLSSVRLLIPFRSGNFFLADRQGRHLLCDPVSLDFPIEALQEYLEHFEDNDPTRWIFISARSMVYRESELFPPEAIRQNRCFQEFYYPYNLYHSLQISLAWQNVFLGSLSFYRNQHDPDFTDDDLFFFDLLKDHLCLRLYRELGGQKVETTESQAARVSRDFRLTGREEDILTALLEGQTTPEISRQLCISQNTVKKHTTNLYRKLNVSTRWELQKLVNG